MIKQLREVDRVTILPSINSDTSFSAHKTTCSSWVLTPATNAAKASLTYSLEMINACKIMNLDNELEELLAKNEIVDRAHVVAFTDKEQLGSQVAFEFLYIKLTTKNQEKRVVLTNE